MSEELKQLKKNYEIIVAEYLYYFCKKYKLTFEFWVADEIGTIANFDPYFINFEDIKYDIDNEKKEYLKYYDYCEGKNFIHCLSYKNFCLKEL